MIRLPNNLRRGLPTLLLSFVLSGCAVLTIDVDVYKGPLVDEPHIQMQELAVLATSAKPLLVQLRRELERPGLLAPVKDESGDRAAWVDDPKAEEFRDEAARRVNDILYLYEDASHAPGMLGLIIEDAKRESARYRRAWGRFEDVDGSARAAWKRLKKSARDDDPMVTAYTGFFENPEGQYRDKYCVLRAHVALAKREASRFSEVDLQQKLQFDNPRIEDDPVSFEGVCPDYNWDAPFEIGGSSAAFLALTNRDLVDLHANHLFGDRAQAGEFVDLVTDVSQAFLDWGDARANLVQLALRGIIEAVKVNDPRVKPRAKQLALRAIDFVVERIHPAYLRASLELLDPSVAKLKSQLRAALDQPAGSFDKIASFGYPDFRLVKPLRDVLADLLNRNPGPVADTLLTINRRFINTAPDLNTAPGLSELETDSSFVSKIQINPRRMYGIVSIGLVSSGDERAESFSDESFNTDIAKIFVNFAGGLERGRLPEGLDTLVEKYLEAAERQRSEKCPRGANTTMCKAKHKLIDALVRFSTKLLFIANNETLMGRNDDGDQGIFPRLDRKIKKMLWEGGDASVETYTQVLQAVGNSILVLSNEVRHQDEYRERLRTTLKDIENFGMRGSVMRDPKDVFDDLVKVIHDPGYSWGVAEASQAGVLASAAADLKAKTEAHSKAKKKADEAKAALSSLETAIANFEALGELLGKETEIKDRATTKGDETIAGPALIKDLRKELFGALSDAKWKPIARQISTELDDDVIGWKDVWPRLDSLGKEAKTAHDAASPKKGAADQNLVKANQALSDALAAMTTSKTAATTAQNVLSNHRKELAGKAGKAITRFRKGIQEDAAKRIIDADPPVLMTELKKRVAAARDVESDATKKSELAEQFSLLEPMPLPSGKTGIPHPEVNDAIEVADTAIAVIEYDRMRAIRDSGKDSPIAKHLDQALERAWERRARLIPLRPASAFLRTSFKTTAQQRGAALRSRNMLGRHALRQFPGGSQILDRGIDYRTLQDIDKQFWQNVNHVKVAGAGDTNYVVAKDDVGNWYVKNVSADPEKIIRGAQSLALFAAGPAAGVDLLNPILEGRQPGRQGTVRVEKTKTGAHFAQFQAQYQMTTRETRDAFAETSAGVADGIKNSVSANSSAGEILEPLGNSIDAAAAAHLDPSKFTKETETPDDLAASAQKASQEIVAGLNALRRFNATVQSGITALDLVRTALRQVDETEAVETAKKTAHDAAQSAVAELEAEVTSTESELATLDGAAEIDALNRLTAARTELAAAEASAAAATTNYEDAKTAALEAKAQHESDKALDKYLRATARTVVYDAIDRSLEIRKQHVAQYRHTISVLSTVSTPPQPVTQ